MGIRIRGILCIAVALLLAGALAACAGAEAPDDGVLLPDEGVTTPDNGEAASSTSTQGGDAADPPAVKYATVAFEAQTQPVLSVTRPAGEDTTVITSLYQLEQLEQQAASANAAELGELLAELRAQYDAAFFESRALVLVCFCHSSTEKLLELTQLVIKDGALCPVVTIDSQGDLSTNIVYSYITAEVLREDVAELAAGELLVINNYDPTQGSSHHARFE